MASRFLPVEPKVDFARLEEEVLAFWKREAVVQQAMELRRGRPAFVFYEGPPTANGLPHVGHVIPRAMKDLVLRYKTMRGYYTPRKAGWDTHGLPVELEVEKELGLKSKADIEAYGVAEFVARCRESVFRYEREWARLTERIGFWLDLDHAYVTCSNDYIESVWWSLRRLWDKGLLYEGYKVVPYCPRCGTSLSSHEVAQGYAETEDPSVLVRFPPAEDEPAPAGTGEWAGASLLVWTTTPWTLPSNVAVAVAPGATYALVEVDGGAGGGQQRTERLVLAAARLEAVLGEGGDWRVLAEVPGRDLAGLAYRPPFDFFRRQAGRECFRVHPADFVSLEDGTGLVHVAPGFGEADLRLGQAHGLPVFLPVDEAGRFTEAVGPWRGRFVKEADPDIVADLDARGLLYRAGTVVHTYPFCWRCDSPLLYYARTAWFVRMTALRDRLLAHNAGVRWVPEHLRDGRFGNFLESVVDWCLSRERYWGTPLPLWRCGGCGAVQCVGSVAELRALARPGTLPPAEGFDLHKPAIDGVLLACPSCGGDMRRVPEVIDCWYDSGAMPFAQHHYPFEGRREFAAEFPADFICEAIDQTRGWFYSLLAEAVALFDATAYRSVLCTEFGLDEAGRKMSKHKGNVLDPWEVIDRHGADALRWFLCVSSPPWYPKRFSLKNIAEFRRQTLDTLWNTYAFFVLYADLDGFDPVAVRAAGGPGTDPAARPAMDRWLLSRVHRTAGEAGQGLEAYDVAAAARAIASLVDDVSNWYVRRSRRRFWRGDADAGPEAPTDPDGLAGGDKTAAYLTLYEALVTLARLLAPFTPFLAEALYLNLVARVEPGAPPSVHLTDYPQPDPARLDPGLEAAMATVRAYVALGRAARTRARLRVRQPLAELVLAGTGSDLAALDPDSPLGRELLAELQAELNVRQVRVDTDPAAYHDRREYVVERDGGRAVALRVEVTPELRLEGLARELVNRVQRLRKEAGYRVEDRIELFVAAGGDLRRAAELHADTIRRETLARRLELGTEEPAGWRGDRGVRVDIDGDHAWLGVRRAATRADGSPSRRRTKRRAREAATLSAGESWPAGERTGSRRAGQRTGAGLRRLRDGG